MRKLRLPRQSPGGIQFDDEPRRCFLGGSVRLQPNEEDQLIQSGFSPGPSLKFPDQLCQQSELPPALPGVISIRARTRA